MLFRCLSVFSGLFRRLPKRVVTQIIYDLSVLGSCWEHFVAFPTAERYRANLEPARSFRLEDSQLETASPEVPADGGWFLWDLNATVAGW